MSKHYAEEHEWRLLAACRGMEPKTPDEVDIFFPTAPSGPSDGPSMRRLLREPKSICQDCPVTIQCAQFAMKSGAQTGVWGGLWFGKPSNRGVA